MSLNINSNVYSIRVDDRITKFAIIASNVMPWVLDLGESSHISLSLPACYLDSPLVQHLRGCYQPDNSTFATLLTSFFKLMIFSAVI